MLFLVASLIPLISISIVVHQYTSSYLMTQAEKRLNKEVAILNALLFERIQFMQRLISDGTLSKFTAETRSAYILSTEDASNRGQSVNLKSPIQMSLENDSAGRLYFMAYDPVAEKSLLHEVNKEYLFDGFPILSKEFDYCLLGNTKSLWCSSSSAPQHKVLWHQLDTNKHSQGHLTLSTHSASSELQFVARPLFLGSDIIMDNWVVFASVPAQKVLEPITLFKILFIFVFVMTLLTIGLIGYQQIKFLLAPLNTLIAGTYRLSQKNFSEPVSINSQDEFQELGNAFNKMSLRLENSFDIMNILSEIDRLILQTNNLGTISSLAWARTQRVVRADLLIIATRNDSNANDITLLTGNDETTKPQKLKVSLSSADNALTHTLSHSSKISVETLIQHDGELAKQLCNFGCNNLSITPILLEGELRGFIAVGFNLESSQKNENIIEGLADRLAVSMSNISKQNKLFELGYFDYLTKLPNRKLLRDKLSQAISDASRADQSIAVVFVDLDNFKQVNDSLGHVVGDQLLVAVSEKLSTHLSDSDLVAREGGDEFICVFSGIHDRAALTLKLEALQNIFEKPIQLGGHRIFISISLGVAIYPEHGTHIDKLLMNADTALYKSKALRKASYLLYDESMNADALKRLELESSLWNSITNNELCFYYQPLINTVESKIGFEALLRWRHPEKGFISPEKFIPIAEETGFMMHINQWMFEKIFTQVRKWLDKSLNLDKISINISASQLALPDFVDSLVSKIDKFRIPFQTIELEITESVFLDNQQQASRRLKQLKAAGISIALDDFGTGYSSLSYLQMLPFDRLKIDRSFVSNIEADKAPPELISTIIQMAQNLDLQITAEGVEQDFQFSLLKRLGCQILQGFYISKPLPYEDCVQFIQSYKF